MEIALSRADPIARDIPAAVDVAAFTVKTTAVSSAKDISSEQFMLNSENVTRTLTNFTISDMDSNLIKCIANQWGRYYGASVVPICESKTIEVSV